MSYRIDPRFFNLKLAEIMNHMRDMDEEAKKAAGNEIVAKMDSAGWSIDNALALVIPTIENRRLRNECRRLLIAIEYDAAEDYHKKTASNQPWVDYVGDNCVLIQYYGSEGTSTAILSPEGEIKTPQGQVWINGRGFSYCWCFTARGVAEQKGYGLVYGDGTIVLPCVFNYIENDVVIEAQYKGVAFNVFFTDDEDKDESKRLYYKSYRVSEGVFLRISCFGLKTEHDYSESMAAPLYDGEPLTPEEQEEYENKITEEVFSILDKFYAPSTAPQAAGLSKVVVEYQEPYQSFGASYRVHLEYDYDTDNLQYVIKDPLRGLTKTLSDAQIASIKKYLRNRQNIENFFKQAHDTPPVYLSHCLVHELCMEYGNRKKSVSNGELMPWAEPFALLCSVY